MGVRGKGERGGGSPRKSKRHEVCRWAEKYARILFLIRKRSETRII